METMMNDAECLRNFAETRDQNAFSDFVHRNLRLVYSAALRQTSDAHLAQDISQVVFTTAARNARVLAQHPVIPAWLHHTTRNAAIDALRSRERRRVREEAACAMNETAEQRDNPTSWDKVSPELDRLVASLGEKDREAVILRFFGEKSFCEIGQQLNLSENAARMRVDRALEKLRTGLLRKGVASSATALATMLASHASVAAPAGLGSAAVAAAVSAPAASAAALLWGTLSIMSITKVTTGIATVVAVASLATAVHQFRAARSAEEALNELKTAQARPHVPPAVASSEAEADGVATTTAVKTTKANPPANNPLAAVIAVLSNPAIQAQSSIQTKMRLDSQYGPLFKKLNLSTDQLEQFKNLVVEKQMVAFDSITVATEQGIDAFSDTQGFLQVVGSSLKHVDTQIATLLGEPGFKQFLAYEATIPARNTVTVLSQALSYTQTPLTEPQVEEVVRVLATHGAAAMAPQNPFFVLNSDLGIINLNEQGRAQLANLLSAQQLGVLESKVQQQLELFQTRSRIAQPRN